MKITEMAGVSERYRDKLVNLTPDPLAGSRWLPEEARFVSRAELEARDDAVEMAFKRKRMRDFERDLVRDVRNSMAEISIQRPLMDIAHNAICEMNRKWINAKRRLKRKMATADALGGRPYKSGGAVARALKQEASAGS